MMKTKAKIAFVEFVRPDGYWPQPYTIEQAFEVFRWMVKTGRPFERPTRWGQNGPMEMLSCNPSCTEHHHVTNVLSIEDLRRRFHFALLSAYGTSSGVQEWREAENIKIGAERIIAFRHHKPFSGGAGWTCEADVEKAINGLFHDGKTLLTATSLNQYHPTARHCKSVQIAVEPDHFRFILEYGWPDSECTSHWFHDLARTEGREPFLLTTARAIDALGALTLPSSAKPPIPALKSPGKTRTQNIA